MRHLAMSGGLNPLQSMAVSFCPKRATIYWEFCRISAAASSPREGPCAPVCSNTRCRRARPMRWVLLRARLRAHSPSGHPTTAASPELLKGRTRRVRDQASSNPLLPRGRVDIGGAGRDVAVS
jgi:hypothetical protein